MNKAQIERLTQLARASQGKDTKRPLNEILATERSAAKMYIAMPVPAKTIEQAAQIE